MNHTTLQRRFAARIRDPQQALPPGIATERMAIYEELFFNNLDGFISSGFPVLRQLFDEPRWHRLVRAFMREHRCRTPYFSQLGEEFIGWLQDGYRAEEGDPPFLLELAHYEWVELALSLAEAPVETLPQAWSWSPLAWPLAYRWPVHRLGPSHRPMEP
ncbi:putative DNA-binding domain-containing protein, partial [Pseudomonas aeruginosa]